MKLDRPLRLVPLSPSSGQYIRTHIRSILGATSEITVHANLTDALNSVEAAKAGSIVFVDDNIVSGTQAALQVGLFMGGSIENQEGNYVVEQLDDRLKAIFRSCEVGAAFAVGCDDGAKKLSGAALAHEIRLQVENVTWGKPIQEFSGRGFVSDDLRAFLGEIGTTVLQRRFEREYSIDPARTAAQFALGYGSMEGLLATSLSVPTSTYPAFWCPGFREVSVGSTRIRFPWTPLFLRTNMLQHLVLG
jgi:hypothetical protein